MLPLVLALFASPVSFHRDIVPILATRCWSCHGWGSPAAGFDARTREGLLRGGTLGRAIVPGDPDRSPLIELVEGRRGVERRMPPAGAPLEEREIALLRRWIAEGAVVDRSEAMTLSRTVRRRPMRIVCRIGAGGYVVVAIADSRTRRTLWEEGVAVKPGEAAARDVRPERGWPSKLAVTMTVVYAAGDPAQAELLVE